MRFEYEGFGVGLGPSDLREIPLPLRQQGFKDCAVPRQFWNWLFKYHEDAVVEMVKSRLQFVLTNYNETYEFVADIGRRLIFVRSDPAGAGASRYNYRYSGSLLGEVYSDGSVIQVVAAPEADTALAVVIDGASAHARYVDGNSWSNAGSGPRGVCYQPDFDRPFLFRLSSGILAKIEPSGLPASRPNTTGAEGFIRSYESTVVAFGSDSGGNWCRELTNLGISERPYFVSGDVQAARFRGHFYVHHRPSGSADEAVYWYDISPLSGDVTSHESLVDSFTVPPSDQQYGFQVSENLMVFTFENGDNYTHRVFFAPGFWVDVKLNYLVQLTGDRLWYNTGEAWYATRPLV